MEIHNAKFVKSSATFSQLPAPNMPEYGFVGRSNVGKSSWINCLTNHKSLAKTSSTPGKTQLINHFMINGSWYLADLPGYGYARTSKKKRATFTTMITDYVLKRENLLNLYVLLDSRIKPQKIDMEFLMFLGMKEIPFTMLFTKTDKLTQSAFSKNMKAYQAAILETWERVPPFVHTSAVKGRGRKEVLERIEEMNGMWKS